MQNERLGAPTPRSFFMKPTIKQVNENGTLLWEVCCTGMTRRFRYDWQANYHYEAAVRLYRSKVTGKQG